MPHTPIKLVQNSGNPTALAVALARPLAQLAAATLATRPRSATGSSLSSG